MKQPKYTSDLPLYLTHSHPCSYLEGYQARTLFVDPRAEIDVHRAEWLQQIGFRRSGGHYYRPACRHCHSCVPVRVPVADFEPNRSQRRNLKRNADLQLIVRHAQFDYEHYQLYAQYLHARHSDGDMIEDLSPGSYQRFLLAPWGGQTLLMEWRWHGELVAVAVADCFADGLSAVYTFFSPDHAPRAPGTLAILTQIHEARRLGLSYLYLGYWISGSRKMSYKQQFRPLETWDGRVWQRLERHQSAPSA